VGIVSLHDLAIGTGRTALNTYLAELYNLNLHDLVLKKSFQIGALGIDRIEYDFTVVPAVHLGQGDVEKAVLDIVATPVTVNIVYQGGRGNTIINATVSAKAEVKIEGGLLNIVVKDPSASVPGNPFAEDWLNKGLIPSELLPRLNEIIAGLLSPFSLKNLSVEGIPLHNPLISNIGTHLYVYTAFASRATPFSPPPVSGLQTDKLYFIISTAALSEIVNKKLEGKKFEGKVNESDTILFTDITVEITYNATIKDVTVTAAGGDQLAASGHVTSNGNVKITAKFPIGTIAHESPYKAEVPT
jgi:hypothetical protein